RGTAVVSVPLVLHDGVFSEAPRNGLTVTLVGGEVGGDGPWQIESHGYLLSWDSESSLRLSLGPIGRPTVTTLRQDFSVQMQRPADLLALQHAPKPADLVRRLEKRVFTVNGRVVPLHDLLDFTDRCGRDISDALDMLWNEQQMVGIDMPMLDE